MNATHHLSRRRALIHAGSGIAALGLAAAVSPPAPLMAQEASPPADQSPAAGAPGTVTAARAALAVERLPALSEALLRESGVPGMAVAVIHDDSVLFSGGFGLREIGSAETIDADTVFQLASVSKSLAAT